MAARRERERRRPSTERRYQFRTGEPDLAPEEQVLEEELEEAGEVETLVPRRAAPRDGAAAARATTARPFTAYRSEYAYVLTDLRRVVLVVGSLLAVLVVLYFILPR
jgi:hypothetical protein